MNSDFKDFTKAYCECINPEHVLLESHGFAVNTLDKSQVAKESWTLFELMYEYIGRFKSYLSVEDMVNTAEMIQFVYDGPLPDMKKFKIEKCIFIATFNHRGGLKMTGGAANYVCFDKNYVRPAMRKLNKESLKYSWSEVSGKMEKFLIDKCDAMKYFISPEIVKQVYPNLVIDEDGKHYTRGMTDTGDKIRKIAFGTIHI